MNGDALANTSTDTLTLVELRLEDRILATGFVRADPLVVEALLAVRSELQRRFRRAAV